MGAAPVLTILRNGETVLQQELEGDAVLGRADDCVIRLDDRAVSRQHAVFRRVGDGVQVEKKSEFAPLMVNGAEANKAVVRDGDVINIGPYLLRVTMPKVVAPPPPAAPPEPPPPAEGSAPELSTESAPSLEAGTPIEGGEGLAGMDAASAPPEGEAPVSLDGAEIAPADGQTAPDAAPAEGGDGGGSLQLASADPEAGEILDEEAKTKLTPSGKLNVRLVFKPGTANHTEFELTKDEISIGRGKNCDIVLNDKKSSRKNTIIRRAGMSFVVKDLDSANGTFVNGVRVKEQELAGEDTVRVGGVDFVFHATSADYAAKERDFMSLPAVVEEEPAQDMGAMGGDQPMDAMAMMQAGGMDPAAAAAVHAQMQAQIAAATGGAQPGVDLAGAAIPGLTGVPGLGGPSTGKKTLKDRFKALPKRTQGIVVVVLACVIYWAFIDDSDESPGVVMKKHGKPKASASSTPTATGPQTYDTLSPEKKRFVESEHALAFDYYKNKEYDKALFELDKIHALIPEFRDSREIERYAKEGKRKMEALEDERKKKEEEARIKAQIATLVQETSDKMSKHQYDQARELFPQVLALDPDNVQVVNWRKQIDDEEDRKKQIEQEKNVQQQINKRAQEVYAEAMAEKKAGKFHAAIGTFGKVGDTGTNDKKLVNKAKAQQKACLAAIKAKFDPVLAQAKEAEQGQEFSKAYKLYQDAIKIDPWREKEPRAGMHRIYSVLKERAKVLFTEGVLFESYSDYGNASKKFKECLEVAPETDEYHDKAARKLAHYYQKDVSPGGGGGAPQ
jgi:pSer/pThr/pTyr-binding forkhead associated (FHA) protein/tetratricopeptide (TPR) repeat protein